MIIKKIILILILFSLSACDYEPIYVKKNLSNITIKNISLEGDRSINRKIISLSGLSQNKDEKNIYNLKLDSNKIIETVAKNKEGNTSIYRTTISVNFILEDQGKIFKEKSFISSFSYNNLKNKFELSEYQKNIESNLIEKIVDDILVFINT